MAALRSPDLIRAAKPPAIGVFGDIAVAVGPDFLPFLDAVLIILNQAAATEVTDVSVLSQVHVFPPCPRLVPSIRPPISGR